jgi:hypothetical protein
MANGDDRPGGIRHMEKFKKFPQAPEQKGSRIFTKADLLFCQFIHSQYF